MGEHHGGILQAHFDRAELIIRKSQLYDFSTKEKAQDHIRLLLQYMASDPVGDTKTLAPGPGKST